jgi:hypothetical protein
MVRWHPRANSSNDGTFGGISSFHTLLKACTTCGIYGKVADGAPASSVRSPPSSMQASQNHAVLGAFRGYRPVSVSGMWLQNRHSGLLVCEAAFWCLVLLNAPDRLFGVSFLLDPHLSARFDMPSSAAGDETVCARGTNSGVR